MNDDRVLEFHLTRDGWVKGSESSFGRLDGAEISRPEAAVETWEERITQRSMHSETYSHPRLVWSTPALSQSERDALRGEFPKPFEGGSPSPWQGYTRTPRATNVPAPASPAPPHLDFGD